MCPGRPEAHSAEIVELAIERIGARGDGVAQYRGEPVFVPFTVPGDRVRARLGARRHGGWEGYVADRIACGPERAAPPSPTPLTPTSAIVGDHQRDRSPRFPNRGIALRTRKG